MMNLIVIHMESLSCSFLQNNLNYFPCLQQISKKSLWYSNYYGSATSTYMVLLDLFLGGDYSFEQCDYLENIFSNDKRKKSLFDILWDNGYKCKNFFLNYLPEDLEGAEKISRILCENGECWTGEDPDEFQEEIKLSIDVKGNPFALFINDNTSHISFRKAEEYCFNLEQWFEKRYRSIDQTLEVVWKAIADPEIRKSTVMLIYGDHGEEYWTHGLHDGYTHAIEPFTDITKCPLYLFDGRKQNQELSDELLSTVDLKELILAKLGLSEYPNSRRYAFSRNLFAHQTRRADVFNKSYSATDGRYTIILTDRGYSLYLNRIDPSNHNNLLGFFRIKCGKLEYIKEYDSLISTHYHYFMTKMVREEIATKFDEMRKVLDVFAYQICGVSTSFGKNQIDNCHYRKDNQLVCLKYRRRKKALKLFLKHSLCKLYRKRN